VEQVDLIWHNGELVAWEDARVHVLTHGLHYGTSVFEGERAYDTPQGTAVFRHLDHLRRLHASARLYYMEIPYTVEELRAATHELISANGLRECDIRPIAFRGYGQMGINPLDCPVEVTIAGKGGFAGPSKILCEGPGRCGLDPLVQGVNILVQPHPLLDASPGIVHFHLYGLILSSKVPLVRTVCPVLQEMSPGKEAGPV